MCTGSDPTGIDERSPNAHRLCNKKRRNKNRLHHQSFFIFCSVQRCCNSVIKYFNTLNKKEVITDRSIDRPIQFNNRRLLLIKRINKLTDRRRGRACRRLRTGRVDRCRRSPSAGDDCGEDSDGDEDHQSLKILREDRILLHRLKTLKRIRLCHRRRHLRYCRRG